MVCPRTCSRRASPPRSLSHDVGGVVVPVGRKTRPGQGQGQGGSEGRRLGFGADHRSAWLVGLCSCADTRATSCKSWSGSSHPSSLDPATPLLLPCSSVGRRGFGPQSHQPQALRREGGRLSDDLSVSPDKCIFLHSTRHIPCLPLLLVSGMASRQPAAGGQPDHDTQSAWLHRRTQAPKHRAIHPSIACVRENWLPPSKGQTVFGIHRTEYPANMQACTLAHTLSTCRQAASQPDPVARCRSARRLSPRRWWAIGGSIVGAGSIFLHDLPA